MKKEFLKPKYWTLWIVIGFAKLLVRLPYKWQMKVAIGLGGFASLFLKRRKHITLTNLKIAFPEKSKEELDKLAKESFKSAYMAAVESLITWFMPDDKFEKISFEFENKEHFERLHNDPSEAVLLLGYHFHAMEICGRKYGTVYSPLTVVYQKNKNELIEDIITKSREKTIADCFPRKSLLPVIKSLRRKRTLWYAPDQDFGKEHTTFVPFFGKACSTLTVTPWLIDKTKAKVIPIYYIRKRDLSGYVLKLGNPIENFPTDPIEGARKTNEILENYIKEYPEQYLWQHRRYKTRPEGEEKIY